MNENVGWGMARAPRVALCAIVSITALLVFSPGASASHIAAGPDGVSLDSVNHQLIYIARNGELNSITVTETATDYVFTDTGTTEGGVPIPAVDNAAGSGCTVDPDVATCSKTGVDSIAVYGADETGDLFLTQDSIVATGVSPPAGMTIDGGGGNDDVTGSDASDYLLGGAGIDTINGGDGDDVILTGPSLVDPFGERRQSANGGTGFDTISFVDRVGPILYDAHITPFGRDSDLVNCPVDPDLNPRGGCSDDFSGLEKIVGTNADDEMIGGTLNDTFVGNGGADTMCGQLGIDTVDYSSSPGPVNVSLDGTQPTDPDTAIQLVADPGVPNPEDRYRRARIDCRETAPAPALPQTPKPDGFRDCTRDDGEWDGTTSERDCVGEDVENIIGSPYDDVLVGNDRDLLEGQGPRVEPAGANHIIGGGGDDVMDGRGGPDVFDGDCVAEVVAPCQPGTDTVTYGGVSVAGRFLAPRVDPVTATIDGVANDGGAVDRNRANLSDSIGEDVEVIEGGIAADVLEGGPNSDELTGGPGADFLDGGGGSDVLQGEPGADTMLGGPGGDDMSGGSGDDILDGEAGNDRVRGDTDNDTIHGGLGADDVLSGGDGNDTLDYSDATTGVSVTPDGAANDGSNGEGDNVAADYETVIGGIGNDSLVGTAGPNMLVGGDGDDVLAGEGDSDELVGGNGMDAASYSSRSAPVFVDLAAPGGDGEAGENDNINADIEKVGGGSGDDTLLGDARDNVLDGGPGNDRLAGAEGDDLLNGSFGSDSLAGDVGNDTLFGSEGNDTLTGGAGSDDLKGEAGDDSLDGGAGSDRLGGGPGLDRVLYSARSAAVTVNLDGVDKNGERNENDFINSDVENATTGSGGDTIDAHDHKKGDIRCGAGTDVVTADPEDRVAGDCENVQVSAFGTRCTASHSKVSLAGSAIPVKVFCAVDAKGTLRLESAARVRVGKSRKVLKIGSKSFSLKAGQRKTIKVKASKAALRMIKRKKRLSVRARVSAKKSGKAKASSLKTTTVLTVRR